MDFDCRVIQVTKFGPEVSASLGYLKARCLPRAGLDHAGSTAVAKVMRRSCSAAFTSDGRATKVFRWQRTSSLSCRSAGVQIPTNEEKLINGSTNEEATAGIPKAPSTPRRRRKKAASLPVVGDLEPGASSPPLTTGITAKKATQKKRAKAPAVKDHLTPPSDSLPHVNARRSKVSEASPEIGEEPSPPAQPALLPMTNPATSPAPAVPGLGAPPPALKSTTAGPSAPDASSSSPSADVPSQQAWNPPVASSANSGRLGPTPPSQPQATPAPGWPRARGASPGASVEGRSLKERASSFMRTGVFSDDESPDGSPKGASDGAPRIQTSAPATSAKDPVSEVAAQKAAFLRTRMEQRAQAPIRQPPATARTPVAAAEQAGDAQAGPRLEGAREAKLLSLGAENESLFLDIFQKQQEMELIAKKEQELQKAFKTETELELERIKLALHAREADLRSMSRELEEAKAQFKLTRTKAVTELASAQQALAEKDFRLRSLELAMAALKPVKVEFWGAGARVQLAGTFNGWQYHLDLKPDLSSQISDGDSSKGGPMMWDVDLFLYPGTYQVKFIVDGAWQVDQRRETVISEFGQNNILNVDPI